MHQRSYKQLTARDRLLIAKLRTKKLNQTEIARRIGKDKSTVSRELRRNATTETPQDRFFYLRITQLWSEEQLDEHLATQPAEARETKLVWTYTNAQKNAESRAWMASQKRRRKKPATRQWTIERLRLGWSPDQIAGRSKAEAPEPVSHEFVYALVYRDKKRGGRLYRHLRRFGRRKQRFGARDYGTALAANGRVSIEDRPAIVDKRTRLGDYEADLIVGHQQSGYILSVVDRTSRATVLRRLTSKRMDEVRIQLQAAFATLGVPHTLTVDNGTEFYGHRELVAATGIRIFFTHPYSSIERGSVENLNGLVRYYLPKRSSFAHLTQERLDEIAALLNDRPRRCLDYLTPNEVHFKH